jgi:hypothetical protein
MCLRSRTPRQHQLAKDRQHTNWLTCKSCTSFIMPAGKTSNRESRFISLMPANCTHFSKLPLLLAKKPATKIPNSPPKTNIQAALRLVPFFLISLTSLRILSSFRRGTTLYCSPFCSLCPGAGLTSRELLGVESVSAVPTLPKMRLRSSDISRRLNCTLEVEITKLEDAM